MPNNHDFTKLADVKTKQIEVEGWTSPILIEYGTGSYGQLPAYFWRVKGTKHTFVIPTLRMDYVSKGNYEEHFQEALTGFREDYIGWKEEGFYSDWMKEYKDQFSRFISI